jgi:hypothetical protein
MSGKEIAFLVMMMLTLYVLIAAWMVSRMAE